MMRMLIVALVASMVCVFAAAGQVLAAKTDLASQTVTDENGTHVVVATTNGEDATIYDEDGSILVKGQQGSDPAAGIADTEDSDEDESDLNWLNVDETTT